MLICDKRRPARARGYQYQAPPRGPNKDSPPGLRPAPRALLRVGRHAPRPPGLRPLVRLRAPGPCCLGHPAGGVPGTGAPGGRGGQPLAVVHAGRPAPPPLPWIQFFKSKATGAWASRRLVHRRASVPAAAAVGRPRHRPQGGCPPWVGSGVVHGQSGPQGRAPAPPGTRFPPAAGAPPYVDS